MKIETFGAPLVMLLQGFLKVQRRNTRLDRTHIENNARLAFHSCNLNKVVISAPFSRRIIAGTLRRHIVKGKTAKLKEDLSHYSRAIAHPARIEVLQAIVERGNEVNGEIVPVANVSPTTVIQHLRELKRAGLIGGRIFGAKAHYWIETENLSKFISLFKEFENEVKPILEKAGISK